MNKRAIGRRLEEARILKGLKQCELTQILGIGKSCLSRYECGAEGIPPKLLGRIATELDCDPLWLLTGRRELENTEDAPIGSEQDILSGPVWVKNYVNKYLNPIRASAGAEKYNLKSFIKQWNKSHPGAVISYQRFMAMRRKYQKGGVWGLFPHYGKSSVSSQFNNFNFDNLEFLRDALLTLTPEFSPEEKVHSNFLLTAIEKRIKDGLS